METKKKSEREPLRSQVRRLAAFIMANVPGEPSKSEGAIDTAIRIIREKAVGPEIKVGDVVRLKSGGAEMTVSHVYPGGYVEAMWMNGYEKGIGGARLPVSALVVVEKKKDLVKVDRGFETRRG